MFPPVGSVLSVLPFLHVYGITVAMNEAIDLATTMIVLPRFNVNDALGAINPYKPTRLPGVPMMPGFFANSAGPIPCGKLPAA